MKFTVDDLSHAANLDPALAAVWYPHVLWAFEKGEINTPHRMAHWLAQFGTETGGFKHLEEKLVYSPERLMQVFPSRVTHDIAQKIAGSAIRTANFLYGGRNGNQHEGSGDGYRFRGRGLPHVTFRDNYNACGKYMGINLLIDPDKLLQPQYAAGAGEWFWTSRGLNKVADVSNSKEFTLAFNGFLFQAGFKEATMGIPVDETLTPMDIRLGALGVGRPDLSNLEDVANEETGDVKEITKTVNGGYNGLAEREKLFNLAISVLGDM